MFSNFLPITSAFFGWVLLGEALTGMQMLGGIIVVAAACIVIREKGRIDS
jgi:drug/metabolite transporter (DMT)-like permease